MKQFGIVEAFGPHHKDYVVKLARLNSFNKWPLLTPTPEDLADAGFFFLGVEDRTCCFYCDLICGKWVKEDEPWKEHSTHNRSCAFLKLHKGLGWN